MNEEKPIRPEDAERAIGEFKELVRLWEDSLRFEAQRRLGNKICPVGSTRERILQWLLGTVRRIRNRDRKTIVESRVEELKRLGEVSAVLEQSPFAFSYHRQYRRTLNAMLSSFGRRGPNYVDRATAPQKVDSLVKLIALYLPQFHPIPENDAWWGRGFTEWTNVAKSIPVFEGHYQPHLPDELGFYDLRVPEILEQQASMAEEYGIYGFAFYYYSFGGKRLLEMPMDQFVASERIKLPFCILWANENWTRAWDGQDKDVLMPQNHDPATDMQFIQDLAPYLKHPRYIRIKDRPLIIVFRPALLPDAAITVARWREYCIEAGLGNPYLISTQSHDNLDPRDLGFDATMEFPPTRDLEKTIVHGQGREGARLLQSRITSLVYSYPALAAEKIKDASVTDYVRFETVCPMWDNSARRPGRGNAFAHSNPELYRTWLAKACSRALASTALPEPIVFVNAWNEWAEGAHLEPDQRYGFGYLQATREALDQKKWGSLSWTTRVESQQTADSTFCLYNMGALSDSRLYRALKESEVSDRLSAVGHRVGTPEEFSFDKGVTKVVVVAPQPMTLEVFGFIRASDQLIPNLKSRLEAEDITPSELHQVFLHMFEHPRPESWLDDELEPALGLDILNLPFDPGIGYALYAGGQGQALVLREEDLSSSAVQALCDFVGLGSLVIPKKMELSPFHRDLLALFLEDRKELQPYVERVHSSRYSKQYYSEPELAAWHLFGFSW